MDTKSTYLNLGSWQERSLVNGPGERFVLWLQGCSMRCPGCFNEEFLPYIERHLIKIENMLTWVLDVSGIEGVTYTGGEPMEQAQGLTILSKHLRAAGLTIVCYTGYTLDELSASEDPWIDQLLCHVDILIDGPFIIEKASSLLWRGSSNQRVHFLTDTYKYLTDQIEARPAEVEFAINRDSFTTTGTWPSGFLERLERKLRS